MNRLPRINIEQTALIVFFLLLSFITTRPPVDNDIYWHLRAGERIVAERAVFFEDTFSHTFDGQRRIPHDWLGQVVYYGADALLGNVGVGLLTSALAISGMAFLWKASEGRVYLRAFALVMCVAVAQAFWASRPQMFSFLLSTVVLWVVYRYKRHDEDRLWLLPPIFALWVNLHGGWAIGAIILLVTAAGEVLNHLLRSRSESVMPIPKLIRLIVFSALAAVALILNPAGFDMLLVPLDTFQLGALRMFIEEWNPPDITQPHMMPFPVLLIGVTGVLLARWRRWDWTETIMVGVAGYLAVTTSRNVAFFATVAAPVLSYHVDALVRARGWLTFAPARPTPQQVRLNWLIVGLVALMVLAHAFIILSPNSIAIKTAEEQPVAAVQALLEQRPPREMFNNYNWGGYLIQYAREYPVFTDGRSDLYGTDFLLRYADAIAADESWRALFEEYAIQTALLEPEMPLTEALIESGWQELYRDDVAVLLTRP